MGIQRKKKQNKTKKTPLDRLAGSGCHSSDTPTRSHIAHQSQDSGLSCLCIRTAPTPACWFTQKSISSLADPQSSSQNQTPSSGGQSPARNPGDSSTVKRSPTPPTLTHHPGQAAHLPSVLVLPSRVLNWRQRRTERTQGKK